jgi:hypothetical protein
MTHPEWGEYFTLTVRGADERKGDPGVIEDGYMLVTGNRLEVRNGRGLFLASETLQPDQNPLSRARQILGARREERKDWFSVDLPNRRAPY